MSTHEARFSRDCIHCHGEPPKGFACPRCFTIIDGPESVFLPFADIELGDTDELDPAWDALMEHPSGLVFINRMGLAPIVISQLFRLAIDSVKQQQ